VRLLNLNMAQYLGLKVIYKSANPSNTDVDIVIVHGLAGNSYTTWFDHRSSSYWPLDFLRRDIPQSRILTFGHDATLTTLGKGRVDEKASGLLHSLRNLRSHQEEVSITIHLICHV
jgi:hypothetical protein